jgi:hypothetical protein
VLSFLSREILRDLDLGIVGSCWRVVSICWRIVGLCWRILGFCSPKMLRDLAVFDRDSFVDILALDPAKRTTSGRYNKK